MNILDLLDVLDQYDREQEQVDKKEEVKSEVHSRLDDLYNFIDQQSSLEK